MSVTIRDDDWLRWELVRPVIRRMYLVEGKSGSELLGDMSTIYHFYAT